MKRNSQLLPIIILITLTTSCTTVIKMQKTYPPEAELPADNHSYVFVNFYDYLVPEFIKAKHLVAYAEAVNGYSAGLAEIILHDNRATFMTVDTLRKGFTVLSMQYPEFTDTVRAICMKYNAGLLVALDSLRLWVDQNLSRNILSFVTIDGEEGGTMAKDFYIHTSSYMTLYASNGEVVDRCSGELSDYIKTKYTISGMIGGPTLAVVKDMVGALAKASAKECIGRFFPVIENYSEKLNRGGPFNKMNKVIIEGHPEEALEPLRLLTLSPEPVLAKKAFHNLKVANEMLENRKSSDEVWNKFRGTDQ